MWYISYYRLTNIWKSETITSLQFSVDTANKFNTLKSVKEFVYNQCQLRSYPLCVEVFGIKNVKTKNFYTIRFSHDTKLLKTVRH